MQNATKILRIGISAVFISFMTACAAGPYSTETMTNQDFLESSASEQDAYLAAVTHERAVLKSKNNTEFKAGRPVYFGTEDTGYTLLWDSDLEIVYVYPGHTSGAMGAEQESMIALRSDSEGNVKYQSINGVEQPTILLANVMTQEGIGRALLRGGFQVVSSSVNGAVAAKIYTNQDDCGDNCVQGLD
jgi:hypothetical protein